MEKRFGFHKGEHLKTKHIDSSANVDIVRKFNSEMLIYKEENKLVCNMEKQEGTTVLKVTVGKERKSQEI